MGTTTDVLSMHDSSTNNDIIVKVRKRDGNTIQKYNSNKIVNAIHKAFDDVHEKLNNADIEHMLKNIYNESYIAATVTDGQRVIDVDTIQTIVKRNLMDYGFHAVAEAYIVYSNKRNEFRKRRLRPDISGLHELIHYTKYSKWDPETKKREPYEMTVDRSYRMHSERYPEIAEELRWAFDLVLQRKAIGSMRSMQFGGPAQLAHHAKGYNCSFSVCNRLKFFSEAFYLLLCGTGVGFSVQYHHVEQLPELKRIDKSRVKHYTVHDSIEGWADALHELIYSYIKGIWVEFNYSKIRPQGARLKTSGGKAPGHLPLRNALESIRKVLDQAQGRQLDPIECYDITCLFSQAVYAGGVREAALICLFSHDDGSMMRAKVGDWSTTHPWRARSNNSVVLLRNQDGVAKDMFKRVFKHTKEWGEPGFYFTDDLDIGTNPCVEISLKADLTITPELKIELERWATKTNRKLPNLKVGDVHYGWQQCNLSSVNCAACNTTEEFYGAVKAAAIIGTAQAGYTDFPYLGWVTEAICNREALLGVSLTGIMDKPEIALNQEIQQTAAQIAVATNAEIARKIGINSAARVTCVKPHGNSGLLLGSVGSGIHPHHARRYLRNIRINPQDPVYKFFKSKNPHMCSETRDGKCIITFPIQAPDGAITRKDLSALEFMNIVMNTQINWVLPGTAKPNSTPHANHNVSNTITVRDHEWKDVAEFIWKNRKHFTGVSMLADIGDHKFEMAPCVEIKDETDEAKWNHIIANYKPINWDEFTEDDDNTEMRGEVACAGGKCELI